MKKVLAVKPAGNRASDAAFGAHDSTIQRTPRKLAEKPSKNPKRVRNQGPANGFPPAAQTDADLSEYQQVTQRLALELRTPLRHLDSLLGMLQRHSYDKLDPKNRDRLEATAEASRQLAHLADELLNFSRIDQIEMYRLHFSLAEVVKELLHELGRETENRQIEWVIGEMPEVLGDPLLLGQALNNLLTNALKFTRPRPQACITIDCRRTQDEIVLRVSDNGVGFEPWNSKRLFKIFQRLHPEFEGLGLGLANVRRIVQRHGGRVWAEGELDQGAHFYLALPQRA